jgi:VanZ family protein
MSVSALAATDNMRRRTWRGLLKYWSPLAVWLVAIFFFSTDAMSAGHTASIVEPLVRWFHPHATYAAIEGVHAAVRKAGHVSEYGLLALLAYRAVRWGHDTPWRWPWGAVAWTIAVAYACTDELHQTFVASRTGTLDDVYVDAVGAACALLALAWWRIPKDRAHS